MRIQHKFNFHSVADRAYAIVRNRAGLAVDTKTKTLLIFTKQADRSWTLVEADWDDCRDIRVVEPDAALRSSIAVGHGLLASSGNVGNAIGTGMSNMLAKKRANDASGVIIRLKSIEHPEMFIPIPETEARLRTFEAVAQFFESGDLSGRKIDFPVEMQAQSADPMAERNKTYIEGDTGEALWKFFTRPRTLFAIAAIFAVFAHQLYSFTERHGGFANAFPEDRFGFFAFVTLAGIFGILALVRIAHLRRSADLEA